METAAARFRSAGYRSGFHYLLEAKRMHVEHGHAWTEQLKQSLRDCRRALERGIGPSKRAGELRVSQIAQVEDYLDDEHEEGPQWPRRAWLIATFWVLREIELANVRIRDVELHTGGRATLRLPMSKMDQSAQGCDRSIHCCCELEVFPDGDVRGSKVCAACAVRKQLLWRYSHGGLPADHLFCDSRGQAVEKKLAETRRTGRMRQGIRGHQRAQREAQWCQDAVSLRVGPVEGPVPCPMGIGHSEALHGRGVERTGPPVADQGQGRARDVPRSAKEVGLDEVREEVERLRKQQSRRPRMHEPRPLAARVNQEELAREIARIIDGEGKFLQNVAGDGKVHRLLCAEGSVESWKTQCGWAPAGRGRFRLRLCPPSQCELRCQRCFEGAEEADSAQSAAINGPTPAAA